MAVEGALADAEALRGTGAVTPTLLERGEHRRIGGTEYRRVDVRVIAATNRDIQQMVDRGEFRQDLYYRLSAFPVHVPPLREHKSDIPAIAEHFLGRIEDGDRHIRRLRAERG